MNHKVRVGARYLFAPVFFDRANPPVGYKAGGSCKAGDIVTVTNLHGCPKAGTMGQCHVLNKDGQFAGLVCVNSLWPVNSRGRIKDPEARAEWDRIVAAKEENEIR